MSHNVGHLEQILGKELPPLKSPRAGWVNPSRSTSLRAGI